MIAVIAAARVTFGVGGFFLAAVVLAFFFYCNSRARAITYTLLFLFVIALFLPPISKTIEAARRNDCVSCLKQISLALHGYRDTHGCFPPAYIADENGRPMHSWRVLILPYIGLDDLYEAYDFSEPWDRPNNKKLAAKIPYAYRCPSAKHPASETSYLAVVGPQAAWPDGKSSREDDFVDGMSRTIMIVESHGHGVHWMEPKDLSFDEAVETLSAVDPLVTFKGHPPDDTLFYYRSGSLGRNVAYGDAHVDFMQPGIPRSAAAALLTKAGGEPIKDDDEGSDYNPIIKSQLNWSRVCTLSLFIALVLLPAPWAWRARSRRAPGDA